MQRVLVTTDLFIEAGANGFNVDFTHLAVGGKVFPDQTENFFICLFHRSLTLACDGLPVRFLWPNGLF